MKRTIKISLWAALIVFATQLNASDTISYLDINMVGSKSFELTTNKVQGKVKIKLLNAKKEVLYAESFTTVADGLFKKTFDLGLFPDGNYSIEVTDEVKMQSLPITIANNDLTVNTVGKVRHFLPNVHKKNQLVRVSMPVFDEDYLEISLLDENETLLFKTKVKGNENIGKVFDFSKTGKGSYQFLLSSKAGFVSKQVVID